jgi:hypothetical protein
VPLSRRAERRATWLHGHLRTRRLAALRAHRTTLAGWSAVWGALVAASVLVDWHHPQWRAFMVGAMLVGFAESTWIGLTFFDGSLAARYGRFIEEMVGDGLRTAAGVWAVVSNVPFEHFDVDHLVIARRGVFAVEVKTIQGSRAAELDDLRDVPSMLAQAQRAAHDVRALLRSEKVHRAVRPVLVLVGSAVPTLPPLGQACNGVIVVAWRDNAAWLHRLGDRDDIDEAVARAAHRVVAGFRARRWAHNATHACPRPGRLAGFLRLGRRSAAS